MSAANGAGAGPVSGPGGLRSGLGGVGGVGGVERPGDIRSAELVSRLLAATPPYLYNMPLVPHSYFFSEMLRSFVHAKNNNEPNRQNQGIVQQPGHRRSRKRSWNQSKISPPLEGTPSKQEWAHRSDLWNNRNMPIQEERQHIYDDKYAEAIGDINKNQQLYEKPLELTINKNNYSRHMPNFKFSEKVEAEEKPGSPELDLQSKMRKSPKASEGQPQLKEEKYPVNLLAPTGPTPPALSLPPPPPPLWYPPLYPPPYGIDPLNFFIDLRVSGHIYDRKHGAKEAQNLSLNVNPHSGHQETPTPELNLSNQIGQMGGENNNSSAFKDSVKSNRHVSAFSVPKPREANGKHFPINLCHNGNNKFNMKYYDDVDVKVHERNICGKNTTSTHYVMQNLKRIYGDLSNHLKEDAKDEVREKAEQEIGDDLDGANDSDSSEAKKKRRKDLRALIGLELVVDYVKSKRGPVAKENDEELSEDGRDSSSDVEVLGELHED